jgi:hypothetical protein
MNLVFNSLGEEAEKKVAQLGYEEKLPNYDSPKETASHQVCVIVNDSLKADMGLHYSNPASLSLSASKCACAQFVCISLEHMIPFLCVAGIQEM